jgi:hypothetical protein
MSGISGPILSQAMLLSPRATKLPDGYRFLPVRMYVRVYVHMYVRMYVRMIVSCHRSSDFIYRTMLTKLHTNCHFWLCYEITEKNVISVL